MNTSTEREMWAIARNGCDPPNLHCKIISWDPAPPGRRQGFWEDLSRIFEGKDRERTMKRER